ncbi:hypothetical protein [Paenibacillus ehimensis]|uniref:hypothetical protein n=1 Tax=Paenibacillus ehimensis TaxID=79264 RepID=UPI0004726033|nr:hypothetical protein [Paenibacillus ehimensis]
MKLQVNSKDLGGIYEALTGLSRLSCEQGLSRQTYSVPAARGTVHLNRIRLREGMEINWFDASFREPVTLDVGVDYPHLEIAYTLSGQGCWETKVTPEATAYPRASLRSFTSRIRSCTRSLCPKTISCIWSFASIP